MKFLKILISLLVSRWVVFTESAGRFGDALRSTAVSGEELLLDDVETVEESMTWLENNENFKRFLFPYSYQDGLSLQNRHADLAIHYVPQP